MGMTLKALQTELGNGCTDLYNADNTDFDNAS